MQVRKRTRAWKWGLVLSFALGFAAAVHPPRVMTAETNAGFWTWNINGCLQKCDPTQPGGCPC